MERMTDDTSVVCQESVPEFVSARITFQLDIGNRHNTQRRTHDAMVAHADI